MVKSQKCVAEKKDSIEPSMGDVCWMLARHVRADLTPIRSFSSGVRQ